MQVRNLMHRVLVPLAFTLVLGEGHPAASQDIDPEIVRATAGEWLAAPVDGSPGCRMTLTTEGAIGGYGIEGAEEACAKTVPLLVDAAAWNFGDNGQIILIDPLRKVLVRFDEQEGSPHRSNDGTHLFFLQGAPKGLDAVPTPDSLAGEWALKRPKGEVLCTVTLGKDSLEDETHTLSPSGDCVSAVSKLKLFRWQQNGLSVSLLGKDGNSIAMDGVTPDRFEKTKEEGGKPLIMERKH